MKTESFGDRRPVHDESNTPDALAKAVPAFVVRGLRKNYLLEGQRLPVLRGATFSVLETRWTAFVGRSGSGKTTLLHLLGALDRPSGGHIWCEDLPFSACSGRELCRLRLRRIGFVFQAYHLFPELTALENVMLPALRWGWNRTRARGRAAELLESFGLGDRLRHRPQELSGGEQQRVALARALMNNPDILIADEPTGNLDVTAAAEIVAILRRLHHQGMTIVMVTHDLELARCADVIMVVRDGRVAAFPPDAQPDLDPSAAQPRLVTCPSCETSCDGGQTQCPNCTGRLATASASAPNDSCDTVDATVHTLMDTSRQALRGQWAKAAAVTGVAATVMALSMMLALLAGGGGYRALTALLEQTGVLGIASSLSTTVQMGVSHALSWLVWIGLALAFAAVKGALLLGCCTAFLGCLRSRAALNTAASLEGFRRIGVSFRAAVAVALLTALWSLLLVVPGLIALLNYAMTPFILADSPSMRALEAMRRSREMMYGRKARLFLLGCRCVGWLALGVATGGLGLLVVIPYMLTGVAAFYEDVRQR